MLVAKESRHRRVAIYARVSTSNQTVENQLQALREAARGQGWQIVAEFFDAGISGSKGRDQRPSLDQLLKRAQSREFDLIMVWAIDRLGRSIQHLIGFMNDIQAMGVDLYIHQQSIDTTTAAGRMTFSIFSALGEYERELMRERIVAGQRRARAHGVRIGRPTKLDGKTCTSAKTLRENGIGIKEIASRLGIGVGSVYAALQAA